MGFFNTIFFPTLHNMSNFTCIFTNIEPVLVSPVLKANLALARLILGISLQNI